ncbi:translation initiation factor IF-2 [Streptomyces sp. AM 3-1-1]|uniref:translation initiation factor IF-2 n=1 Tax=Streptomyces sp. AM 3-1-1 TaxID=3028711 RepID=UPI0023B9ADF3|nr:translation initiation factor IF-2 [Streptomyces sp. AM 3-1-1]WEH28882.1 translation initiation factor IF-2 [Streptomyces sp. AM 3-1-1]
MADTQFNAPSCAPSGATPASTAPAEAGPAPAFEAAPAPHHASEVPADSRPGSGVPADSHHAAEVPADPRPGPGVPADAHHASDGSHPGSGVVHVRTRLTTGFTVLANALLQRRGSAVTVGVAAYILSLPDGAPVTIDALRAHFTEGEILISRALRELEAAGYLERRRVRLASGRFRTCTYLHDVPVGSRGGARREVRHRDGAQQRAGGPPARHEGRVRTRTGESAPLAAAVPSRVRESGARTAAVPRQSSVSPEPVPLAAVDPRALLVLASLRRRDPRLVLSERDAADLSPAIGRWLASGLSARRIADVLTERLPDHFVSRPAALLAFRLRDTPLSAPPESQPSAAAPAPPAVHPFHTCDGCERVFRSPHPGRCRDCRSGAREGSAFIASPAAFSRGTRGLGAREVARSLTGRTALP